MGFSLVTGLPGRGPDRLAKPGYYMEYDPERSSIHYKLRVTTFYKNVPPPRVAEAPKEKPSAGGGTRTAQMPRLAEPRRSWSSIVPRPLTKLVSLKSAPFPYDGTVPWTHKPFLNFEQEGRRAHKTRSGRVYWADETYSDNRVLVHIPKGFDIERPAVIVLFFHGHGATLERDVARRQRLPAQITESGMNAVLVAPQFAVDARDSSAGKFWQPGGVRRFLDEATAKLAQMHGGPEARRAFVNMPVVIVGYSGGYLPTAWALAKGGISKRVKGVVLLDGLYGELGKFEHWIARRRSGIFLSAYTRFTRRRNEALKKRLAERDIPFRTEMPARLQPGSVTFVEVDKRHRHYVTTAWVDNPIADLLVRLDGVVPRASIAQSASLAPGFAE